MASVVVLVGVGSNLALDTAHKATRVGCMGLRIEAHFVQVGVEGDSKADAGGEMKLTGAAWAEAPQEADVHLAIGMGSGMEHIAKEFGDAARYSHPGQLDSKGLMWATGFEGDMSMRGNWGMQQGMLVDFVVFVVDNCKETGE